MGKPFNFSAIFSRRNRADEADPEDNSVVEGEGEGSAPSEEEQGGGANEGEDDNSAASEEEQGGANEDDPPAAAKTTAAEKQIRASERNRIGRITTSKAAVGRVEAALSIAVNTSMPAAAAIALLGTLPVGGPAPTKGLSDRMNGLGDGVPPDRGGGGDNQSAGPMSFKQIQARRMDRAASATTRTPRR